MTLIARDESIAGNGITTKTSYTTSDDREFDDHDAAALHQGWLDQAADFAAWCSAQGFSERKTVEYSRVIEAWEGRGRGEEA